LHSYSGDGNLFIFIYIFSKKGEKGRKRRKQEVICEPSIDRYICTNRDNQQLFINERRGVNIFDEDKCT
jgi:hypothetical protein